MRKELIILYDEKIDCNTQNEFIIYTRDELIHHIQTNNIDISKYNIDLHTPINFIGSIERLKECDQDSEFFIDENNKIIIEYLY